LNPDPTLQDVLDPDPDPFQILLLILLKSLRQTFKILPQPVRVDDVVHINPLKGVECRLAARGNVHLREELQHLGHAQAGHQLEDCNLDIDDACAAAVEVLAGAPGGSVPHHTLRLQFQARTTLNRLNGLLPDIRLAARPTANTKNKKFSSMPFSAVFRIHPDPNPDPPGSEIIWHQGSGSEIIYFRFNHSSSQKDPIRYS